MVPRHGSYGAEAIQALIDNITLPEFRGNLIIILGGYHDSIEELFDSNPGFRARFDKRRVEFPSWTAEMAANATLKQIEKDGLSVTVEARELLPHMYEQLASLPDWGSARDVYRNILPAMYSKRSKRLAAEARMEKIDAEAATTDGSSVLKVQTTGASGSEGRHNKRSRRQQVSISAPYTAMDVREAFAGSLKSRGKQGHGKDGKGKRPAWPRKKTADSPPPVMQNPSEGSEKPQVNIKKNVTVRIRREDDDSENKGGWDNGSVTAALEEACVELGYSLDKIEEILTAGKYPQELIELVISKSGCSDVAVLKDVLDSQKGAFLAKIIALKKQKAEAQTAAERLVQDKIRHIGKCPMNFDWLKIPGGYQCAGGSHFISDAEISMA